MLENMTSLTSMVLLEKLYLTEVFLNKKNDTLQHMFIQ